MLIVLIKMLRQWRCYERRDLCATRGMWNYEWRNIKWAVGGRITTGFIFLADILNVGIDNRKSLVYLTLLITMV